MIDLFCGVGGIRLGFEHSEQVETVFACDIDKNAAKTYEDNFGMNPIGDITLVDEKTLPKFDILVGGFPCQAFSNAGKRKGFDDTRGTLFFDVARIIKENNPKVILLENVKGLVGHDVPLILDNYGIRKLTPRECFDLQGFPKDYKFPDKMSDSALYKQSGNSVSVSVVSRIATEIFKVLNN